ncbi:MAG: c-type cytochrome [Frankiaceae bacterium]|nr:c-type cytochrome [Frankiaceae bacterium]MBV9871444.1 c-type cytochrome [Frankiaceae bacterium]
MENVSTSALTPDTGHRSGRRRFAHAGIVLLVIGLFGFLYAAFAPSHSAATSSDPAIEQGRQLYLQGCSSCHGLNGEGGVTAPSLIGVGAAAADFQMSAGFMPLRNHTAEAERHEPAYDDTEIEQISAYIGSLGPGPAIPTNLDYQSAPLAFGGQLFRTNCAQCHNFAGSGGALTYGKSAPSLSSASPKEIYEAMLTGPENMPVFGDQQITPAQKLAIVNYVRTIKTSPNPGGAGLGRIGPVSETAVAWLVGIGVCVVITMWIGSKV